MKDVIKLLIVSGDSLILCAHWNFLNFKCLSEQLSKSISQKTTCEIGVWCDKSCMMSLWENCSL